MGGSHRTHHLVFLSGLAIGRSAAGLWVCKCRVNLGEEFAKGMVVMARVDQPCQIKPKTGLEKIPRPRKHYHRPTLAQSLTAKATTTATTMVMTTQTVTLLVHKDGEKGWKGAVVP